MILTTTKIVTGSSAFFNALPGFSPKDVDYIKLVNKGEGYRYCKQVFGNKNDIFFWVRRPKAELIEYALHQGPAMQVIKFLTPEFCQEVGFTVEDLPLVRPLIDKLDEKHAYAKVIYEAYLENGGFILTDKQRLAAYEIYKQARPEHYGR